MKTLTWGQYYHAQSVIHRLDPRVKLRFTIGYILLLLPDRNLPLFTFMTILLGICWGLSHVPVRKLWQGASRMTIFLLMCSAINLFTVRGKTLVAVGKLVITAEGVEKAGFVFWRMVLLIGISCLLMYTTTPTNLTDGLEKLFFQNSNVAMGITIALRFLPIFTAELDRIKKAQELRGANFHTGSPVARLKKWNAVMVPLFQNAIHTATNLGDAMDARCYEGGKGRTKLKPLVYRKEDMLCYGASVAILFVGIWMIIQF